MIIFTIEKCMIFYLQDVFALPIGLEKKACLKAGAYLHYGPLLCLGFLSDVLSISVIVTVPLTLTM